VATTPTVSNKKNPLHADPTVTLVEKPWLGTLGSLFSVSVHRVDPLEVGDGTGGAICIMELVAGVPREEEMPPRQLCEDLS